MLVFADSGVHHLDEENPYDFGAEAVIYRSGAGEVVKIFRRPDDPQYLNRPQAQKAAGRRLKQLEKRLADFPGAAMPAGVVRPISPVYSTISKAELIGYSMPFIDDSFRLEMFWNRPFRQSRPEIDQNWIVETFKSLYHIVSGVHVAGAVIGDFSAKNILVHNSGHPHLVDVDSMAFGRYQSPGCTEPFVDHLIYDIHKKRLLQSHSTDSDWYSYALMLCWALLRVKPYGGLYRRNQETLTVLTERERVNNRISIVDPRVQLKAFQNPHVLPDELIEYIQSVFEFDQRGPFPLELLDGVRWTSCRKCGMAHARPTCPNPGCNAPGIDRPLHVSRYAASTEVVFKAKSGGRVIDLIVQDGKLRCLHYEDGGYFREGDQRHLRDGRQIIMQGGERNDIDFRMQGQNTLLAKGGKVMIITPSGERRFVHVDTIDGKAIIAANAQSRFWVKDGHLIKDGRLQQTDFGEVGPNTRIWLGDHFGFGLNRSKNLTRGFVFDPRGSGFMTDVKLPHIPGIIEDAHCVFDDDIAWMMVTVRSPVALPGDDSSPIEPRQALFSSPAKKRTFCYVIDRQGAVLARKIVRNDEQNWLSKRIRGHAPSNGSLLVATDHGICQYRPENGSIILEVEYPNTSQYVGKGTHLLKADDGVYASSYFSVRRLQFTLVGKPQAAAPITRETVGP